MRHYRYIVILLALLVQATFANAVVVTIRTGQVGGFPGTCPGVDDTFHYYDPQTQCAQPIQATPFSPTDFDRACAGPPAVIATAYPGAWLPVLSCDPDARWIANTVDSSCFGTSVSVLYCAEFNIDSACPFADSVRVCWVADDGLGDPVGDGPNPGGVYINGVSLGPNFAGGNYGTEMTAVAYNVPIVPGLNRLEVYQRDRGCAVAGTILSATLYVNCGSTPAKGQTWGSIKSMYQ
jgi:hypothetical protein